MCTKYQNLYVLAYIRDFRNVVNGNATVCVSQNQPERNMGMGFPLTQK